MLDRTEIPALGRMVVFSASARSSLSILTIGQQQLLVMSQPNTAESTLQFILIVLSEVQEWKIDWKAVQAKTGSSRADVG